MVVGVAVHTSFITLEDDAGWRFAFVDVELEVDTVMIQVDNVLLEDASISCTFKVLCSDKEVVIGPP